MDKKNKLILGERIRLAFQTFWTFLSNSYILGFTQGKIYQGRLKSLCVPGLNCYSCPGALGSCPVGSLQASLGKKGSAVPFYIFGFLFFFGGVLGRYVCGWLCPFGLIQDIIHKIPFPKKLGSFKGDKVLRGLKYLILALFVILLPFLTADAFGTSEPWFCKYICPAGTVQGGIPLALTNSAIRQSISFIYTYKVAILLILIILSLIIYRPFCKYLCPLGAIYSFFNKAALMKIKLDKEKCVTCGKCESICPMNIDPVKNINGGECIRCRKCISCCPTQALSDCFSGKKENNDEAEGKK